MRFISISMTSSQRLGFTVGRPILAAASFQAALDSDFAENFFLQKTLPKMQHYQRRLPHWDTIDQPLFVTFRLHGSLPAHRVFPSETQSGKAFVIMDRLLDRASEDVPFVVAGW